MINYSNIFLGQRKSLTNAKLQRIMVPLLENIQVSATKLKDIEKV